MDPKSGRDLRALWAFWIACGLAVVGAVAPFLLGGGSNRITGVVFPFALAAVAFGACALLYLQGRPIATALYFMASLAIVYGILSMLAVPLRVAVLGTCPGPGPCALGLERPMTTGETTALGFSVGMGIVAILTGFLGLLTLYHRHRLLPPPTPPARRIAPVDTRTAAETVPAATPVAPSEVDTLRAPGRSHGTLGSVEGKAAEPEPEPMSELPAHEPELELPAHAPEHTSSAAPAPQRAPRQRRGPKTTPDSSAPTNSDL